MAAREKFNRKQQILETLALMLEQEQGRHITTAALAKKVGVSEAALYRHFPGKAQMFEALIEFIEDSLFTRINLILSEKSEAEDRSHGIATLVLAFADKNPGIARLMHGDVLVGETEGLRQRVEQVFNRLQTQLKQVLREGHARQPLRDDPADCALHLMALVDGLLADYVRSGFSRSPLERWDALWKIYQRSVFA